LSLDGMWPFRWYTLQESAYSGFAQFQTGWFLLVRLQHWARGLTLGSDSIHHNDLTQFKSHIVLSCHVAIAALYFARVQQFWIGGFPSWNLWRWIQGLRLGSDMLHHPDVTQFRSHILLWWMWPFWWNISQESSNFESMDSFHETFSAGLRASD
jgi:hypothetical protein